LRESNIICIEVSKVQHCATFVSEALSVDGNLL